MPSSKVFVPGFATQGGRTQVLIEPADPSAIQKVHEALATIGGTRVEEVTPGFISAEVPTTEIEGLQRLGRVNVVPPKQYRKF